MQNRKHLIRGAFSPEEDTSLLRDGIPLFNSKEDAAAWCKRVQDTKGNLNPQLRHAITTFIGWGEVQEHLIPRLAAPVKPPCPRSPPLDNLLPKQLEEELASRLGLPHHMKLSAASTANSLKYAFHQMRCGILVQIRNNQVYTFAPFVNDTYRNSWGNTLRTDFKTYEDYVKAKLKHYRPENTLKDMNQWWANGNIICNEHDSSHDKITQWWGDNMLMPFKHMLETVCRERKVPDVDFFFNKRDHPQLRRDPHEEAYDFMFDQAHTKLPEQFQYSMLTPFCSFYCSKDFSDLPCPTVEDWKNATKMVFPETTIETNVSKNPVSDLYLEENFRQFYVNWEDKANTAFFRGNATGGGVTVDNNQRLHLAAVSAREWAQTKPDLLDARVTGFNVRDKKLFGEPMRFANTHELKDLRGEFVPMFKQGTYKYIIYVEGHCAANRYSFLMRLGSVIFKLESTCTASELWFFPLLKPQDCSRDFSELDDAPTEADHVPIKADLSDLEEKIMWCRRNDHVCRRITENAQVLYNRVLSKKAILDYWELLFSKIADNRYRMPSFYELAGQTPLDPPQFRGNPDCCAGRNSGLCARCKEEKEERLVKRLKQ